jgi:hypothetical protein
MDPTQAAGEELFEGKLKHLFNRLGQYEQALVMLVETVMGELLPTLIAQNDNLTNADEYIVAGDYVNLLLGEYGLEQHIGTIENFANVVRDRDLMGNRILAKEVLQIREVSLAEGAANNVPWVIIIWLSIGRTYGETLTPEFRDPKNFEYYVAALKTVATGLVAMEVALKEWVAAGQPLTLN